MGSLLIDISKLDLAKEYCANVFATKHPYLSTCITVKLRHMWLQLIRHRCKLFSLSYFRTSFYINVLRSKAIWHLHMVSTERRLSNISKSTFWKYPHGDSKLKKSLSASTWTTYIRVKIRYICQAYNFNSFCIWWITLHLCFGSSMMPCVYINS